MIGRFSDLLRHLGRQRHWNTQAALGRRGEDLAHRFLRRRGFTIVARNYRLASGDAEADIIAWEKGAWEKGAKQKGKQKDSHLVFVEVKSRETGSFGPPERAIGEEKRAHLLRVAREYTRKTGTTLERVRFDVVTVVFTNPPAIELFRGIFSATSVQSNQTKS